MSKKKPKTKYIVSLFDFFVCTNMTDDTDIACCYLSMMFITEWHFRPSYMSLAFKYELEYCLKVTNTLT